MADDKSDKSTQPTAPLVMPKAVAAVPADPFPRKRHYADGYVFNKPIHYYADRTEAVIKQSWLDGGNSEDQTKKDLDLVREALKFHEVDFKKA